MTELIKIVCNIPEHTVCALCQTSIDDDYPVSLWKAGIETYYHAQCLADHLDCPIDPPHSGDCRLQATEEAVPFPTEKANRSALSFSCKSCGFSLHADLNASRNVRLRGILARQALGENGVLSTSPQAREGPPSTGKLMASAISG